MRYADDCNIFVRSLRAGQRVMASIRRFLERRLRLLVNEEKSKVARPEEIHFLGFRLRKAPEGKVEVHISARTKERLDARIRELTPRNWGQSSARVHRRRRTATCRAGSPTSGSVRRRASSLFHRFDAHIRRRLRAIIVRQKKRPRHLYRHLLRCDVSVGAAAQTAYCRRGVWYQSNTRGMTAAYPNAWFHERLVSLKTSWYAAQPTTQAGLWSNLVV